MDRVYERVTGEPSEKHFEAQVVLGTEMYFEAHVKPVGEIKEFFWTQKTKYEMPFWNWDHKLFVSDGLQRMASKYFLSVDDTRVELFDVCSAVGALVEVRAGTEEFLFDDYSDMFLMLRANVAVAGSELISSDRFTFLTLGDPDVYKCIRNRYPH
ncbi:unnamed protein product [Echinostoma caproni]|uniref:Methyltransf_13 domain-containing protein n=1 Tax=Echinostoma caproni TaxID=27848 RepID=A0A183AF56_9TREM|nr:unnamed protein product [Echinostoma caproni]